MTKQFLVSVICKTYNHSSYIKDALCGFAMQRTDFPYVCIIVDDASSDGEPEIIRQYMKDNFDIENNLEGMFEETDDYRLCFASHKTNRNCYFAVFLLKYNHYGKKKKEPYYERFVKGAKYISLCEGDDYWINEKKLQRQVDFLNMHQEYTMCFHNAIEHFEYGNIKDRQFSKIKNGDYSGLDIFKQWTVPTASVVLRTEVMESDLYKIVVNNKAFIYGDAPLFVTCANFGKVRGMDNVMSVYRRNLNSVTHQRSYERVKTHAYYNLEFYHVFGETYKSVAVTLFSRAMMVGFIKSIVDKDSPVRFYFLKESLSVSYFSTLIAGIWVLGFQLYRKTKKLL